MDLSEKQFTFFSSVAERQEGHYPAPTCLSPWKSRRLFDNSSLSSGICQLIGRPRPSPRLVFRHRPLYLRNGRKVNIPSFIGENRDAVEGGTQPPKKFNSSRTLWTPCSGEGFLSGWILKKTTSRAVVKSLPMPGRPDHAHAGAARRRALFEVSERGDALHGGGRADPAVAPFT